MDGTASKPPMEGLKLGLRERKAAATRVAIALALRARLATTALQEISVDDLAADANVSRMTFFNYFPSKEHAVDFLMIVFIAKLEGSIAAANLTGVRALSHLFETWGEEVADAPERMRRLVAYFASRTSERPLPVLGAADRMSLGLSTDAAGSASLGELLMRLVDEARAAGELLADGSSYELAHYLGALVNGSATIGHSSPDTDWRRLFRRHVRRALGLLGSGRGTDPPPPRVPAMYRKRTGRKAP